MSGDGINTFLKKSITTAGEMLSLKQVPDRYFSWRLGGSARDQSQARVQLAPPFGINGSVLRLLSVFTWKTRPSGFWSEGHGAVSCPPPGRRVAGELGPPRLPLPCSVHCSPRGHPGTRLWTCQGRPGTRGDETIELNTNGMVAASSPRHRDFLGF